jgi:hypothetical protein
MLASALNARGNPSSPRRRPVLGEDLCRSFSLRRLSASMCISIPAARGRFRKPPDSYAVFSRGPRRHQSVIERVPTDQAAAKAVAEQLKKKLKAHDGRPGLPLRLSSPI